MEEMGQRKACDWNGRRVTEAVDVDVEAEGESLGESGRLRKGQRGLWRASAVNDRV